jgi:phospholipase A2
VAKLKDELSMAPWSLSHEIWEEAHDAEINPEIIWDAEVRISKDLCEQEKRFLRQRRKHTAKALAKYLDIPESEIHPDDVPTVAMCGSGGGLRALVAGAASYLSAHETGLFDVVTYSAGVSGSCWLQALYYSSVGDLSHQKIINHLKQRIGIHIADPTAAVALLNQAPTNKYLLSGYVEKLRGVPDADFGLVDIYGLLLAARLMVPKGELGVSDVDLKVSNQSHYTDDGRQPLPIYTAVRHEIPAAPEDLVDTAKEVRFDAKHFDWFQWFEWTPYEFFCEELEAGIPTWAMGRRFHGGKGLWRDNGFALPELRVPLMMGIWGSAFCATLSHYLKEVSPVLKSFGFARLDAMLAEQDDKFVKVHPIDPAVIPNFLLGLREQLPSSCPEDIHEATHLELMDAGMSNNLPIYPLLRPGRNVDVIIAFDASADVRGDNWVKIVDGYARQRNIKGWPMGAGWPPSKSSVEEVAEEMQEAEDAAAASSAVGALQRPDGKTKTTAQDLGHCTVWVGTTEERAEFMEEPASRRLDADDDDASHLAHPQAGIALVYFPFTANDKVEGVDPLKSDFMSTWNFVYTPEQIGQVVQLARANFKEGEAQTKRTIEAVWRRKRDARLQREREQLEYQRRLRLRRGRAALFRNGDVGQGDQFSGI